MAYNSFTLPTSPRVGRTTEDIFKEHSGLRRSHSGKDLSHGGCIRRSYSDNNFPNSISCIKATGTQPKLKNSSSMGIFPFQVSSSILPSSLRSFFFDSEEKDVNIEVNSVGSSEGEEIKKSNWMERLLEIRSHWRNRQQKEHASEDVAFEKDDIGQCACGGDGGCTVSYTTEEGGKVRYNRESFSKFLVSVPWSDTKLFSQLAFLCNMAYVIPEIKVPYCSESFRCDLPYFSNLVNGFP